MNKLNGLTEHQAELLHELLTKYEPKDQEDVSDQGYLLMQLEYILKELRSI